MPGTMRGIGHIAVSITKSQFSWSLHFSGGTDDKHTRVCVRQVEKGTRSDKAGCRDREYWGCHVGREGCSEPVTFEQRLG